MATKQLKAKRQRIEIVFEDKGQEFPTMEQRLRRLLKSAANKGFKCITYKPVKEDNG